MRTVIVHYHLFKNAGTSLDHALQRQFGSAWAAYERPTRIEPAELGAFLAQSPSLVCVSSHNAVLPVPTLADTRVVPVLFVRHPVDRARSVYDFESTQGSDTLGSQMARKLGFRGYVEWRLDYALSGDSTICEFQTRRLAMGGRGDDDRRRALDAVERLPFIGAVEEYQQSIVALGRLLAGYFPALRLKPVRLNATTDPRSTLGERLEQIRARLGDPLYQRLESANGSDMALWWRVLGRYYRQSDIASAVTA